MKTSAFQNAARRCPVAVPIATLAALATMKATPLGKAADPTDE